MHHGVFGDVLAGYPVSLLDPFLFLIAVCFWSGFGDDHPENIFGRGASGGALA